MTLAGTSRQDSDLSVFDPVQLGSKLPQYEGLTWLGNSLSGSGTVRAEGAIDFRSNLNVPGKA